MNTSYIYSATRAHTLANNLLHEADIERLFEASSPDDQLQALKESYLATYVMKHETKTLADAIEQHLLEVKQVVASIAPDSRLLAVLWLPYDFHNLRVFMRAKAKQVNYESTIALCSRQALYAPEDFYQHAVADTLNRLEPELSEAYHQAYRLLEERQATAADQVVDAAYFRCLGRVAQACRDPFVLRYVALQIDLHNVFNRLRTLAVDEFDFDDSFIPAGTVRRDELETKEQVLAVLRQFGGDSFWHEAIKTYQTDGHSTLLDVARDDYVLQFVTKARHDLFSPAALFAYVLQARQAGATLRSVVVGMSSGVSKEMIRHNLRSAYEPSA